MYCNATHIRYNQMANDTVFLEYKWLGQHHTTYRALGTADTMEDRRKVAESPDDSDGTVQPWIIIELPYRDATDLYFNKAALNIKQMQVLILTAPDDWKFTFSKGHKEHFEYRT